MLAGAFHATRPSHPEDDDSPRQMPKTQAEVAETAHRRWSRHRKWMEG
jgi:hypothetical protein